MAPLWGTFSAASARRFGRGGGKLGPNGPPTSLSASPAYAGASNTAQMTLTWVNGDTSAKTQIYNGASLVTTVNEGVTTYTVGSLSSNTSYSFTAKHFKDNMASVVSNTATNTTYRYNGEVISYSANYANPASYTNFEPSNGTRALLSDYATYYTLANGSGGSTSGLTYHDSTYAGWPGYAQTYTYTAGYWYYDPGCDCDQWMNEKYSYTYTVPSGVSTIAIYGNGNGTWGSGGSVKGWGIAVSAGQTFSVVTPRYNWGGYTYFRRNSDNSQVQFYSYNDVRGGMVATSNNTISGYGSGYEYINVYDPWGSYIGQGYLSWAQPGTSNNWFSNDNYCRNYPYGKEGYRNGYSSYYGLLAGGDGFEGCSCGDCGYGDYTAYGACCGYTGAPNQNSWFGVVENPTYHTQNSAIAYVSDSYYSSNCDCNINWSYSNPLYSGYQGTKTLYT